VTAPQKAMLIADWQQGPSAFPVQYNPTEMTLEKGVQLGEVNIPGLDAPLQQFVRGQAEKLTVELFFDTTDEGTDAGAVSVIGLTDRVFELVKIDPERHAPPVVTFLWGPSFPGDTLGLHNGNQMRSSFTGVAESVNQKFTLFSSTGVPLRATVTLRLREYRPLDEQISQLRLSSPDRSHAHITAAGDTLSAVAARYYRRPQAWRAIAEANDIDDPRRIDPGMVLRVPPLE
jgi:hypothetical protein